MTRLQENDGEDRAATIRALRAALEGLADAVQPVLAAHRSKTGHVTAGQITAAWATYDEARRTLK